MEFSQFPAVPSYRRSMTVPRHGQQRDITQKTRRPLSPKADICAATCVSAKGQSGHFGSTSGYALVTKGTRATAGLPHLATLPPACETGAWEVADKKWTPYFSDMRKQLR
jgi:hypothetical protein